LVGLKGRYHSEDRHKLEDYIKWIFVKDLEGADWIHLAQDMAGSCEHVNEPSVSKKRRVIF
jgi:hypothetical protein